jgi:hypothetical protein
MLVLDKIFKKSYRSMDEAAEVHTYIGLMMMTAELIKVQASTYIVSYIKCAYVAFDN